MQNTMGASAVDDFARLYLVPGVSHCGGGEGNPNIDLVSRSRRGWSRHGAQRGDDVPDRFVERGHGEPSGVSVSGRRAVCGQRRLAQRRELDARRGALQRADA
jgi:hypothetical protein